MTNEKTTIYPSRVEEAPVHGGPPGTKARRVDDAMKAFEGQDGQAIVLDEATNKRLLRKIDLHIMPVNLFFLAQRSGRS